MKFPRENMIYHERHCPPEEEKLHCLIPAPKGYMTPFEWPKTRDYVHYANVPHKNLTVEKTVQNWVQFKGNVFKFPGGGTMFPQGADAYIDELGSIILIADDSLERHWTPVVASWGAYVLKRNVLAMSFTPRDNHEAQCSRCLIPWTANDEMHLMEVDRVLRPGGYKKMETCITPYPKVSRANKVAGGELEKFPARLFSVPPRIAKGFVEGVSSKSYQEDNKLWKKHVNAYKRINKLIGTTRYRKVMDMNAGLGGFTVAL
ncbi:putative methyltransferase PMT14 [Hibiscus syriacus]|uniref:Methyltransferase n=1 Tax=Hibiscus syriacus TaxID=106335 RepID=A0A6A3CTX4_HIBSY|nr:putative methyltransferase PMT14 [Hibiscus syriacus]